MMRYDNHLENKERSFVVPLSRNTYKWINQLSDNVLTYLVTSCDEALGQIEDVLLHSSNVRIKEVRGHTAMKEIRRCLDDSLQVIFWELLSSSYHIRIFP